MEQYYTNAVAFILEGDTEKVFYLNMLEHFCRQHTDWILERIVGDGEVYYCVNTSNSSVLIKLYVVQTISNMVKAHTWFDNRCKKVFPRLKWTVFLCYDTDNYSEDITKFYAGDWDELRKRICKGKNTIIIDLASSADIEDTMLLDYDSIIKFLEIDPITIPTGNKGKRIMKKLFRIKGPNFAYHEGSRAEPLIKSLDMNKIISLSPIPFIEIEKALKNDQLAIGE